MEGVIHPRFVHHVSKDLEAKVWPSDDLVDRPLRGVQNGVYENEYHALGFFIPAQYFGSVEESLISLVKERGIR